MKHVAIALGGRESQICIRAADGTIVEEKRHSTRLLPRLMKRWEPSRVITETSAEAIAIADAALTLGREVRVVLATLVKTLGVGDRGVKNDRKDAHKLREVSCRIDPEALLNVECSGRPTPPPTRSTGADGNDQERRRIDVVAGEVCA